MFPYVVSIFAALGTLVAVYICRALMSAKDLDGRGRVSPLASFGMLLGLKTYRSIAQCAAALSRDAFRWNLLGTDMKIACSNISAREVNQMPAQTTSRRTHPDPDESFALPQERHVKEV